MPPGYNSPTTILVDQPPPAQTHTVSFVQQTTATALPTDLPKAIAPDDTTAPKPEDNVFIQIGFNYGFNYPFVAKNNNAAAQIFRLLPEALAFASSIESHRVRVTKLMPMNTVNTLGYWTTLAVVSYPQAYVESLRLDVKIASSPLYNNPTPLVYNLTMQINPAIDIILGSTLIGDGSGGDSGSNPSNAGNNGNADPFTNNNNGNQTSQQRGTTAGIVGGAVAVAAAYGAAMFVVARRYKRKKQAHRRASSLGGSPSDMQQMGGGSPALMGGALLSRDFTGYGGVAGGAAAASAGAPGGRDSHGSGRSGMGLSSRTAYISAPVAAENSLGWN